MATAQLLSESFSVLTRKDDVSNTEMEPIKRLKCLITTESTQYGLEDPSCRPSARSSCCGYPSVVKCDVDIRKDLYAKVVLSDSVAVSQGIGEQIAKECNVSYAMVCCFE